MNRWRSTPWRRLLAIAAGTIASLLALVAWLNVRGEAPIDASHAAPASAAAVERGAYLARAGNCIGCHSVPEGADFAGGRAVETPFGVVFSPNITPAPQTGIGSWSAGEFWRALHHGRSKSGRLLYPAFPYPNYTNVTRDDADALYAFLRTVKPVEQANWPHALRFPYNSQAALAVWRALFFRAGEFVPDPARSAEWNRGKYLVDGLGHCAACHSGRNFLGATALNAEFAGSLMPGRSWYAPALTSPHEAGVQEWPRQEVVRLLKTGVSAHATVSGPMAEVVFSSTQYLSDSDLDAMAQVLASIPKRTERAKEAKPARPEVMQRGSKLYGAHCASCHGDRGQGVPGIYPALAGNRAVTLESATNVVHAIRQGGFSPSTLGNPQPFGMPPFAQILGTEDIAAVTTFIRQSWGHRADEVATLDLVRAE